MMFNKERNNIKKIRSLINKNRHVIARIVVSEEFMLTLANYADLIEIETKQVKMTSDYSFQGHDHKTEDIVDQTYLFKVPIVLSQHIIRGAVLEMDNGEIFVLKNI